MYMVGFHFCETDTAFSVCACTCVFEHTVKYLEVNVACLVMVI